MNPASEAHSEKSAKDKAAGVPELAAVLALLACPACQERLHLSSDGLSCEGCGRLYPVVDGIPILLIDRATLPE